MSDNQESRDDEANSGADMPSPNVESVKPSTNTEQCASQTDQNPRCDLQKSKREGRDWRTIAELIFTFVIAAATVSNVCVAARQ